MNLFRKYCTLVLSCMLICSTSLSQDYFYSIQHYTVENGLSDNYISHVSQDSRGYLWIPTTSGLNRFDGHEFKHFSKEKNKLSSNYVEKAFEDKNGKVWIVSRGKWNAEGLAFFTKLIDVFDPVTQECTRLKEFTNVDLENSDIRWYLQDHEKNIWFSTRQGGIYKYDGSEFNLIFKKEVVKNWNGLFVVASDGKIGFFENDQFYLLSPEGQILFEITLPYNVELIFSSEKGKIYAGSIYSKEQDGGKLRIWTLNSEQKKFDPFVLKNKDGSPYQIDPQKTIYKGFKVDNKNRIWIFADDNFLLFDEHGILMLDLTNVLATYGLSPKSIYIDFGKENLIFLSTEKGFLTISLRKRIFQDVLKEKVYNIYGGLIDDGSGNILINQNGIIRLDQNHKTIDTIPIYNVSEMIKDNSGNIWIGGKFSGIHKFDPKNQSVISLAKPQSAEIREQDKLYILCMQTLSGENKLLVARRFGGLYYFDIKLGTYTPFDKYNSFTELKDLVVNHFHKNEKGLWLASNDGMYLMDETKGIIANYKESKNGVAFNEIYHFHEDEEGYFWLGTNGDGLIRWDQNNLSAKQFGMEHGFSHQRIYAVYEDEFDQLWLPSGYGLMQFDRETYEVHTWLIDDGLPFDDFVYHFHHQMPNGRLYFGGGNGGVISFKPTLLEQPVVPLNISSYQEFNNKTGLFVDRTQTISNGKPLNIEPNVKTVQMKMALLDFTAPGNISYAYNINPTATSESSQKSWNFKKDNVIRLNNLPYGNIELEVVAKNADNSKTKGLLKIPIRVKKPFYLKTEFIGLAILALIGIIIAFLKWRTYQLKQDNKILEEEVNKRTKTIESQNATLLMQTTELKNANDSKDKLMAIIGHDLRAPLFNLQGLEEQINYLLETNQMDRLKNLGHSMEKSTRFLTDTLNNLLNWSMNQMGRFPYNPEQVDMTATIENVFQLFEGNARAKKIALIMNIDKGLSAFVDENALSTIIRNLVSNAIKFTEYSGEIIVSGETKNNVSNISISDSGIGMSEEQIQSILDGTNIIKQRGTKGEKSTGLGLILCRDLVIQNKGKMSIESANGQGCIFHIQLPSQKLYST